MAFWDVSQRVTFVYKFQDYLGDSDEDEEIILDQWN